MLNLCKKSKKQDFCRLTQIQVPSSSLTQLVFITVELEEVPIVMTKESKAEVETTSCINIMKLNLAKSETVLV